MDELCENRGASWRRFAPARLWSDCMLCWICAAIFRLSSASPMARPTKPTCWIGLSGFRSPVHAASIGCVLRNSRQTRNERTQGVLDEGRAQYRHHLRSAHRAQWFLHLAGLSRATETHPLQRPGNRQNVGVPDQQHGTACTNDCHTVQKPLASRVVLQVDQATSAYQTLHRQQRERGQNVNLAYRRH